MRILAALLIVVGLQDDIAKYKKDLEDRAYGKLWDRRDAAKALGRMGTREAAQVLLDFSGKGDPATREAIVLGIAAIKDEAVRGFVRDQMGKVGDGRADVAWAFRRMAWDGAKEALHALLTDKSAAVRLEALRALEVLKDARVAEAIGDKDADVAEQALLSCAALKAGDAAAVKKRLDDAGRVQAAALRCLAAIDQPAAEAAVEPFTKSSAKVEARIAAADVAASFAPLKTLLDDKDWRVRVAAAAGMERLWSVEALGALVDRLQKEDGRLVLDIVTVLERMTHKDIGYDAKAWKAWYDAQKETFKLPEKGRNAAAPKEHKTVSTFFKVPILSKRVVFIVDCSGSMKNDDEIYKGKRKIDVAMEEFDKALGAMPGDAKVGVIMLSTEATAQKVRSLGPLIELKAGRKKAVDFLKSSWGKLEDIKRGRGDIYDAILEAEEIAEADTVMLLTDGVPTDGKYIDRQHFLEALAREHPNRRVAVHAILIGSKGIDEKLMEGTAAATGGIYMPRR